MKDLRHRTAWIATQKKLVIFSGPTLKPIAKCFSFSTERQPTHFRWLLSVNRTTASLPTTPPMLRRMNAGRQNSLATGRNSFSERVLEESLPRRRWRHLSQNDRISIIPDPGFFPCRNRQSWEPATNPRSSSNFAPSLKNTACVSIWMGRGFSLRWFLLG